MRKAKRELMKSNLIDFMRSRGYKGAISLRDVFLELDKFTKEQKPDTEETCKCDRTMKVTPLGILYFPKHTCSLLKEKRGES